MPLLLEEIREKSIDALPRSKKMVASALKQPVPGELDSISRKQVEQMPDEDNRNNIPEDVTSSSITNDHELQIFCDEVLGNLEQCVSNAAVQPTENIILEFIADDYANCSVGISGDHSSNNNFILSEVSQPVDPVETFDFEGRDHIVADKPNLFNEENNPQDESMPADYHETASEEENNNSDVERSAKKRRRKAKATEWPRNSVKKLRLAGKAYNGYQRTKDGIVTQGILRPERKIAEACTSVACLRSKKHYCQTFSDEERHSIFNKFWNNLKSWEEKKVYVSGNVDYVTKKRQSTEGHSRRKGTYFYYLRTKENERKRVCKRMFLGTLGLKEDMVHAWVVNTEHGLNNRNSELKLSRVRCDNALKSDKRTFLKDWLESLPKLSSHYCRKDTQKLYLEQIFYTKMDLFRAYQGYCKTLNRQNYIVSFPVFDEIFRQMNLSIYKPKKDRCDVCCSFETGAKNEDHYRKHLEKKERAREEKQIDKTKAQNGEKYTLVVDVQAVKICPVINASAVYYKTKLNCHNFTVYNLATHQSTCYWWNETESDLTASTFTTFLIHYIEEKCADPKLPIITIYSDGCCYQNRNVVMANALFQYSLRNNVLIEQKFLERGHTQMECDAIHAMIEKKLKNRFIHLPSDYVNISREARRKPFPIDNYYVTHAFFKDYSQPSTWNYNSIRPGKKTSDPTVTDLRHLQYNPVEKKILYKMNFGDDLRALAVRQIKYPEAVNYPPLHKQRLKISFKKWQHLQEHKPLLPSDCRYFYDNLPHFSK